MANKKFYNFAYLYIVSGMFVPFAILDDATGKTDGTDRNRQPFWCYRTVCGILYADEYSVIFLLSEEYPTGAWKRQPV